RRYISTKDRAPAAWMRTPKPFTASSKMTRSPRAGRGSRLISMSVRRMGRAPKSLLRETPGKHPFVMQVSAGVNQHLLLSRNFVVYPSCCAPRRSKPRKRKHLEKPRRTDLKSASGKPECRFESGRGHQNQSVATDWPRPKLHWLGWRP